MRGSKAPHEEEMKQRGRRMRSTVIGTPPHTSAHLCREIHSQALSSLHSHLLLVGGVHIFSIFSLPFSQFAGFVFNCTDAAQSQAVSHTPGNTSVHNIKAKKNTEKKALGRTFPSNIFCTFSKLLCLPSQG